MGNCSKANRREYNLHIRDILYCLGRNVEEETELHPQSHERYLADPDQCDTDSLVRLALRSLHPNVGQIPSNSQILD